MSQYRSGIINSTTALIASGVNLMLGFVPDRFQLYNLTILEVNPPNSATVAESLWLKPMPSGSALQTTYTAGAPAVSYITTNGITPVIFGATGSQTFNLYDTFGNPVNTTALGTFTTSPNAQLDVISYPPTAPILNPVNGQVLIPGSPAGLQYDMGYEGLTLGSAVLGANGNVLWWEAIWQTPTGW